MVRKIIIPNEIIRQLMPTPQRVVRLVRENSPRDNDNDDDDQQPGPSRPPVSRKRSASSSPRASCSAKRSASVKSVGSSSDSSSPNEDNQPERPPPRPSNMLNMFCCICSNICRGSSFVQCPTCRVRVHKSCLYVHQPLWRLKLSTCPWICKQCRLLNCSKCLTKQPNMANLLRCHICKVGMDPVCFELFKPTFLLPLEDNKFLCMTCLAFEMADKGLDELHFNGQGDSESDSSSSAGSSGSSSSSDSNEFSLQSYVSDSGITGTNSFDSSVRPSDNDDNDDAASNSSTLSEDDLVSIASLVPQYVLSYPIRDIIVLDVTNWNRHELSVFLASALPEDTIARTIKREIEGRTLLLMRRSDSNLRIKTRLGPLLKVFTEICMDPGFAQAFTCVYV